MHRTRSRFAANSNSRNRCLRRPFVEPLESRAVLSVCGVTCELIDGQLHVHGTAGDDSIAIRYDANTATVQVVGGTDELVGQFPLSEIDRVNFNGLAASDQLQLDSRLMLPIGFSGGEGEKAFTTESSANTKAHQHGASQSAIEIPANSDAAISPIVPASPPAASSSSAVGMSSTSVAGDVVHNLHSSAALDGGPQLQSHSGHYDPTVGATAATASTATSPSHSHSAFYISSSATHDASPTDYFESSSTLALDLALQTVTHDEHESTGQKVESVSKLVPKRCTVTYSGGLLVTSVDGKRQCDCDAKAQAAQEIKDQLAGKENGPAGPLLLKALADCQPCQQTALGLGIPGEFAICTSGPQSSEVSPLAKLPLPLLEHVGPGVCPERNAYADEAAWAADTQWLPGCRSLA